MSLRLAGAALAAVAAVAVPSVASATPASIGPIPYGVNTQVSVNTTAAQCDNTGSTIELSGDISFAGLGQDVLFENRAVDGDPDGNVPGHHTRKGSSSLASFAALDGESTSIPKQPSRGGVGGNPYIFLSLGQRSNAGVFTASTGEVLLGRCVTGNSLKHVDANFEIPGAFSSSLFALSCGSNSSGVGVSTTGNHGGLAAQLRFTNNKNKDVHSGTLDGDVEFTDLGGGSTHSKGWGAGGVGGNPLVSTQFTEAGSTLVGYQRLGRCKDLF
jgi:hypothetical protein